VLDLFVEMVLSVDMFSRDCLLVINIDKAASKEEYAKIMQIIRETSGVISLKKMWLRVVYMFRNKRIEEVADFMKFFSQERNSKYVSKFFRPLEKKIV